MIRQLLSVILVTCLILPSSVRVKDYDKQFDISHKSGTYVSDNTLYVTLRSSDTLSYRLNGSELHEYSSKIPIEKNSVLEVYNTSTSDNYIYTYHLKPNVTPSVTSGTYDEPQTVSLSSSAKLYYTLDGTKPTLNSPIYNSPILISSSCTLSVLAVQEGWDTAYYTFDYNIASTPTTTRYYYNQLSDSQKIVYDMLYNAANGFQEKIDISSLGVTAKELDTAYWAFDYENPQLYWLGNSYTYSHIRDAVQEVFLIYSRNEGEVQSIQEVLDKVRAATASMTSDYDKVRYIHNYIADITTYTKDGPAYIYEADGPLLYGSALCEGYSKAFAYLCNSIGIDAICVIGKTGDDHMWNMVSIEGDWYHVDVTSDDNPNEIWDDFLCTSTADISLDHIIDNILPIPTTPLNRYEKIEVYNESHEAYETLLSKANSTTSNSVTIHCHPDIVASVISLIRGNFLSDTKGIKGITYLYTTRTITVRW